jgi:SAM-dependent methyltransferase
VTTESGAHWDSAYAQGDTTRSWFQDEPTESLRMFDGARVSAADSVIDVGGGTSRLVDSLLQRGFEDISVLDVSTRALHVAQERLGAAGDEVDWIVADLLAWQPSRTYVVWHDRAVFHFLTDKQSRKRYVENLLSATQPTAVAVIGCFALDGPQSCSGLPVARYDAAGLAEQLGDGWRLEAVSRQEHATPTGAVQPFTWAQFRRSR